MVKSFRKSRKKDRLSSDHRIAAIFSGLSSELPGISEDIPEETRIVLG